MGRPDLRLARNTRSCTCSKPEVSTSSTCQAHCELRSAVRQSKENMYRFVGDRGRTWANIEQIRAIALGSRRRGRSGRLEITRSRYRRSDPRSRCVLARDSPARGCVPRVPPRPRRSRIPCARVPWQARTSTAQTTDLGTAGVVTAGGVVRTPRGDSQQRGSRRGLVRSYGCDGRLQPRRSITFARASRTQRNTLARSPER